MSAATDLWDTLIRLGYLMGLTQAQVKRPPKHAHAESSNIGPRDEAVFEFYSSDWHTLDEGRAATGYGQSSISASLRSFRRPDMGGFTVSKRLREQLEERHDRQKEFEYRIE